MSAVLQAHGLLRLCHTIVGGVQFPHGLPLTVDLLNLALAAGDEQVARLRHLLHAPGQHATPAVNLLAVACKLVDAAHSHIRHKQRAATRQAGIAELAVHGSFLVDGQLKLAHDAALGDFHHHGLSRFAVLHKHHMRPADRLDGVNLRSFRRRIAPDGLRGLCHLSYAILMGHQDMSVAHQHGIADLTALQPVLIGPAHLSVLHDEHPSLLALSGIEEVMPRQTLIRLLCRRTTLHRFKNLLTSLSIIVLSLMDTNYLGEKYNF